jgi:integration host factor subunit beta
MPQPCSIQSGPTVHEIGLVCGWPVELLGSLAHDIDGRARLHTGQAAVLPLPESTRKLMMTRADLTEEVSRALDISRKESETIVVAMLDSIVGALRSGDKVEVRRFGSFHTRQRRPRIGRDPRTGARVEVPAKRIPYFRPSKELLELVNSAPAAVIPPAG